MREVTQLAEWRPARPDDVARCACGSEWFRLSTADGQAPAVTVTTDGAITGYAGVLRCSECGRARY